jgi:hypothetical protein
LTCYSYTFPTSNIISRGGQDTNNIIESLNSIFKDIHSLLLLQIIDTIYTYLIKTFYNRYYSYYWSTRVPNTVLDQFNKWYQTSRQYRVIQSGNRIYQVQIPDTGVKYIVNLQEQNCDCTNRQEYIAPCTYTIVAIRYKGEDLFDYFDASLSLQVYRQTYSYFVKPINIENLESADRIHPPQFKKQYR